MCDLCYRYIFLYTVHYYTCFYVEGDNNDILVIIGGNSKTCIVFSTRSDNSTTQ